MSSKVANAFGLSAKTFIILFFSIFFSVSFFIMLLRVYNFEMVVTFTFVKRSVILVYLKHKQILKFDDTNVVEDTLHAIF